MTDIGVEFLMTISFRTAFFTKTTELSFRRRINLSHEFGIEKLR